MTSKQNLIKGHLKALQKKFKDSEGSRFFSRTFQAQKIKLKIPRIFKNFQ